MDIVSRLKQFIDRLGVPVTQFADNCGIPRPTLSQLLNGRNKTVRDELITKIHESYPQLSVMWLMFGEGPQLVSDPQPASVNHYEQDRETLFDTSDLTSPDPAPQAESNVHSIPIDFSIDMDDATPRIHDHDATTIGSDEPDTNNTQTNQVNSASAQSNDRTASPRTITFNTNQEQGKQIVNIIVYYSDNSFQSFIPDPNPRSPFPV